MHDLLSLAQGPAITRPIPRLKRKGAQLKNGVFIVRFLNYSKEKDIYHKENILWTFAEWTNH